MEKTTDGKTRVDLAVDQIIQVILDHDMKAGDKLPNEYELAHELGIGRSTLREAIKRLVGAAGCGHICVGKERRAGGSARPDVHDGRGGGNSGA